MPTADATIRGGSGVDTGRPATDPAARPTRSAGRGPRTGGAVRGRPC
ncbi:hypothetical protein HNR25_003022 [Streptomonospora salina]|uniref:Uncharacterized protein n=1 Tax=Streptomonospora salina TaxID=104205 RepID=A0A841EIN7_9ACTN|nr:hypothetical protein [Streptomonospora salina]